MFVQNLLLSCWACLSGHRASSCQHSMRPLYALKNKGRPRPGTGRSKDRPDIMSLDDPSFQQFCEAVMNDPISRKEYFHEAPVGPAAKSAPSLGRNPGTSGAQRPAPYIVMNRKLEDAPGLGDIYAGACTEEEKLRCRELCGIDAAGFRCVAGDKACMAGFVMRDEVDRLCTHPSGKSQGKDFAKNVVLPGLPITTVLNRSDIHLPDSRTPMPRLVIPPLEPRTPEPTTPVSAASAYSMATPNQGSFIEHVDSTGSPEAPGPHFTDFVHPSDVLSPHSTVFEDSLSEYQSVVNTGFSPSSSDSGPSDRTGDIYSSAIGLGPSRYFQLQSDDQGGIFAEDDFLTELAF